MKIKLNLDEKLRAGIFSQFMMMVGNITNSDIEEIYFDAMNNKIEKNPFDWVFDQYYNESFINLECQHYGVYTDNNSNGLGPIENSLNYNNYKYALSKIKFKKNILDFINNNTKDFNQNCLGVHIRLGDMNILHPQYGNLKTDDYVNKIKNIFEKENFDRIFVASDNEKSLDVLQNEFNSQLLFIPDMIREENDNFNSFRLQKEQLNNNIFWEEAFIECLLLSRCNQLLCRVSNLANATIIFSNTITKIYRL